MTSSSLNITPSAGLFMRHFIEALQQIQFKHKANSKESFALPGQDTFHPKVLENNLTAVWELLMERMDSLNCFERYK